MKTVKLILCAATISGLTGCANHPFNAVNSTAYDDGMVFAWDSKYSAGVGNAGGLCVQGALTARSSALAGALDAATRDEAIRARGGFSFAEAVMALNASSVQTSYGNAGYFYLCQIALNQASVGDPIPSDELSEMWENVGETALGLRLAAADMRSLSAPQLEDVRTYLETLGVDGVPESDAELQEAITDAVDEQGQEDDE